MAKAICLKVFYILCRCNSLHPQTFHLSEEKPLKKNPREAFKIDQTQPIRDLPPPQWTHWPPALHISSSGSSAEPVTVFVSKTSYYYGCMGSNCVRTKYVKNGCLQMQPDHKLTTTPLFSHRSFHRLLRLTIIPFGFLMVSPKDEITSLTLLMIILPDS